MSAATIQQLREAVIEMDATSTTAFSEIAVMSKLALTLLETPKAYQDPDTLACIFSAIWCKAMDSKNLMDCEVERVGCSTQDDARQRRYAAFSLASAITRGEVKP